MNKEELEKEAIKCMHEIKYWLRVPIKKETEKDGISEILKLTEPREKRIAELEAQIEKMKQELDTAREEANRQEQWELYSVLNGIYNDNFEVTTSVSN